MVDNTYHSGRSYRDRDGDIVVPSGAQITVESGGSIVNSGSLQTTTQAAGATYTVTSADAGKTILLDTAAGSVVTLPAASGTGNIYRFVVSTTATSNSHIVKVANTSDTFKGLVFSVSDGSDNAVGWIAQSTSDTITLNRTTTGTAAVGEYIEVQDIATNVFSVRGFTASTGVEATPFSATVS